MFISIRAARNSYLLGFTKKIQTELAIKYSNLNMRFLKYNDLLLKQGKAYPLDIIVSTYKCVCENQT